jgi:hypothetical protein
MSKCAVWGDELTVPENALPNGDGRIIYSPRAGGFYSVTGTAESILKGSLDRQTQMSVTRWIVAKHLAGVSIPEINSGNLLEASSQPRLQFTDKINAVLRLISSRFERMDSFFQLTLNAVVSPEVAEMLAVSDTQDSRDLQSLLSIIEKMGLMIDTVKTINYSRFSLTALGWERVESMMKRASDSSQAFVAMWFDDSMKSPFEHGISPAIVRAGYKPVRIDQKHHVNKVDDEIIAEIRRSRFIVSDFTCEPDKPRGGVYFEAGFAMGLGIDVVWTCRNTSMNDLHFDTRQFNHIVWKEPADLQSQLFARIGAVIGDGPLKN